MMDTSDTTQNSTMWIAKAEQIGTSGRWLAINNQIKRLAANPAVRAIHFEGAENEWMLQVFASLCAQVFEEYLALKKAHGNKKGVSLSEIAWRARNLLELSIWCGYCSKDVSNARRFYEDAGRDMGDLADKFRTWGTATSQSEDWLKKFSDAKDNLKIKMASKGMTNLDDGYKRVSEAAKEIGYQDHFKLCNSTLSKFAHPTAAFVLRPVNTDFVLKLSNSFFEQGCMFFCCAFEIAEIWLANHEKGIA